MTIEVRLHGANGSRTTQVKAAGFTTRHVITPRESVPSIFGDVKLSDRKATPKPITPPAAVTPEPMSVTPKMSSDQHKNDRFLTGIKATLKVSGKWLTAPSVFRDYYNKYNHANVRDIEIGLDILAKADEIQSKVVEGEKQYFLPTFDFERLLDRCHVSRYHLAEITGIDEGVMCGYCKGTKISTADAHKIADKLNIELSELDGMVEVKTRLTDLLAEVDAIMAVQ